MSCHSANGRVRRFAAPQVPVGRQVRDQAAAPVVPQHVALAAGVDQVRIAAAVCDALKLAAGEPVLGFKPGRRQIARSGGVV